MKRIIYISLSLFACGTFLVNSAFSQCKSYTSVNSRRPFYEVETDCAKEYSESSFLSDGQNYRALLAGGESAEYYITFFADNKYRIAACTDINGGVVIYTIKDHKGNVLYTNKDHENAPYWDLVFSSTIDCKVKVQLTPETWKLALEEYDVKGDVKEEPAAETESESSEGEGTETEENAATEKNTGTPASTADVKVCTVLVIGYKQE